MSVSRSKPLAARILILADLMPCHDGTFILRPRVMERDLDTWIHVKEAAALIGVSRREAYLLCDSDQPYLVSRRPARNVGLVSLKSVRAFIAATVNGDFWENTSLQNDLLAQSREHQTALERAFI